MLTLLWFFFISYVGLFIGTSLLSYLFGKFFHSNQSRKYEHPKNHTTENPKLNSEKIVQCHVCQIYIPESQAISKNHHYYCCVDHEKLK